MIWRENILGETFTAVDLNETKYFDLPCVYLMAHEDKGPRIHYVGQTHSLKERFAGHHQLKAALALGATHQAVADFIESGSDAMMVNGCLCRSTVIPMTRGSALNRLRQKLSPRTM